MALSYSCPRCSARIVVKHLASGEIARCRNCGADAMVPANAVPVDEATASAWQEAEGSNSHSVGSSPSPTPPAPIRLPAWLVERPILTGIIPSAMSVISLVLWPLLNVVAAFLAPFAANLLVGWVVGQVTSRRRFLYAAALAAGGWGASLLVFGAASVFINEPSTPNTRAQGLAIFAAATVCLGLVTSPIAAITCATSGTRAADPEPKD